MKVQKHVLDLKLEDFLQLIGHYYITNTAR